MDSNKFRLKRINNFNEFKEKIYKKYIEIFPKNQQKSIETIEKSYILGLTDIIKIIDNNIIVGFMIINKVENINIVHLDYLAIYPKYRKLGYGSKALKRLIKEKNEINGIFLEIEKPGLGKNEYENNIRKRRKNFYENLGFKKLNFNISLFNVIFTPYIYINGIINERKIVDDMMNIYENLNGRTNVENNCIVFK